MKSKTCTRSVCSRFVTTMCLFGLAVSAHAQALIFESAKVGPTNQYGAGLLIGVSQYFGVRFHLAQDTLITGIGGHVAVQNFAWAGEFGAFLVRLPNASALPEGDPFTGEEVVASIVCRPTELLSRDYIFPANIELPAGHYALVFGGVGTNALMPGDDQPLRHVSYLVWNTDGWRGFPPGGGKGPKALPSYRFTLYGEPLR
jgi:hypothetical protein